jgi:inorganic pyrophosphatase
MDRHVSSAMETGRHGELSMAKSVKVFIENEAGSPTKNLHDERSLTHTGSMPVSRPYPFPYGFVLDTTNEDGDNLDCFVLTRADLRRGSIVECNVLGIMEQTENGQQDHNILALLPNEQMELTADVQKVLTDFVSHVFDHIPGRVIRAGRYLGVSEALRLILACRASCARSSEREPATRTSGVSPR